MQLQLIHSQAPVAARAPTWEETVLERVRDLILGGILFVDTVDQDDLPIAARIAASRDYAMGN